MANNNLQVMRTQTAALKKALKLVHFDKILGMYLVVYFITSLLIWAFDDDIKDISDALWFTFASVTTIGYGDLVAYSVVARVLTVLLTIYSMAVVAIFTGIIAGFFMSIVKTESHAIAREFLSNLRRLPDMSHEELVEISERAKRFLDSDDS